MSTHSYVLPSITDAEAALRLLLAGVLGAAVGFEREWRERGAGLRTHMLVCLGSAAITIVSAYGFADYYEGVKFPAGAAPPLRDPARIAAQIVSGIGFLGGGVILRSGLTVRGLTTAASLWAICGVGIAAGSGMYFVAITLTVGLLFALILLRRVNNVVYSHYHHENARIMVRVNSEDSLDRVMAMIKETSEEISSFSLETAGLETSDEQVTLNVMLNPDVSRVDLGRRLKDLNGVTEVHVRDPSSG